MRICAVAERMPNYCTAHPFKILRHVLFPEYQRHKNDDFYRQCPSLRETCELTLHNFCGRLTTHVYSVESLSLIAPISLHLCPNFVQWQRSSPCAQSEGRTAGTPSANAQKGCTYHYLNRLTFKLACVSILISCREKSLVSIKYVFAIEARGCLCFYNVRSLSLF